MNKKHTQLFLGGSFLLLIFVVGIAQAGIEMTRGERPQFLDLFSQVPSVASLRAFEQDLEDASWFAGEFRPRMQSLRFAALKDLGEQGLLGRDDWLFYKPGVQYLIEPWPKRGDNGTAQRSQLAAILSFRDQLAERGIALLVIPAPGKASVYPEMLTARTGLPQQHVSRHTEELISALRQCGVQVFDLFDLFAEAKAALPPDSAVTYYLAQDTHWSPEGVHLAAEAVARRLLKLGWIEKGTTDYTSKPVTAVRTGDVLGMLQAPLIESSVAPQQITCAQVLRKNSGEVYEDDPASDVLVLGDSFMRIYQRDKPGSAGFIAHLARELGRPLASIINDGGASTLVRQELARRPELLKNKRVVLWEFVERDIRFGQEGWQELPLTLGMAGTD